MATYYVNSATGSESNNGTSSGTPWKYIPGMGSSAKTLAAGDTVLIANGSSWSGQRLATLANNVTYRGYGIGGDDITARVPLNTANPEQLTLVTYHREAGVHEGSWKIDRSQNDTPRTAVAAALDAGTAQPYTNAELACVYIDHSNCTFEDAYIVGGGPNAASVEAQTVLCGDGAFNTTWRRFVISGAAFRGTATGTGGKGYSGPFAGLDMMYGKIVHPAMDCLLPNARASNDHWRGYTLSLKFMEIGDPNSGYSGATIHNRGGDCLQCTNYSPDDVDGVLYDSFFGATIVIESNYLWSRSNQKQAIILRYSNVGSHTIRYNYLQGVDGGNVQMSFLLFGCDTTIEGNRWQDPGTSLPVIHAQPGGQWYWNEAQNKAGFMKPENFIDAGVTVTIKNNKVSGNSNQFLRFNADELRKKNANGVWVEAPDSVYLPVRGTLVVTGNKFLPDQVGDPYGSVATGLNLLNTQQCHLKYTEEFQLTCSDNEWWAYRFDKNGDLTYVPTLRLPGRLYATPSSDTYSYALDSANIVISRNFFARDEPDGAQAQSSQVQFGNNTGWQADSGAPGYVLYKETVGGQTMVQKLEADPGGHAYASDNYEVSTDPPEPPQTNADGVVTGLPMRALLP